MNNRDINAQVGLGFRLCDIPVTMVCVPDFLKTFTEILLYIGAHHLLHFLCSFRVLVDDGINIQWCHIDSPFLLTVIVDSPATEPDSFYRQFIAAF